MLTMKDIVGCKCTGTFGLDYQFIHVYSYYLIV